MKNTRLVFPVVLVLTELSLSACGGGGLPGKQPDAAMAPDGPLGPVPDPIVNGTDSATEADSATETDRRSFVDAGEAGSTGAAFDLSGPINLGFVPPGTVVAGRVVVTAKQALSDLSCAVLGPDVAADPSMVCPQGLDAGSECSLGLTFSAKDIGVHLDNQVVCRAGEERRSTTISATVVNAEGPLITPKHASLEAALGETKNAVFMIGNPSEVTSGPLTASIMPAQTEFFIHENACADGIPALGSCTITVAFRPTSPGERKASLVVTEEGAPFPVQNSVALTGIGRKPATLTITPDALVWDGIFLNTLSVAKTLTVTNSGDLGTGSLAIPTTLGSGFVISENACATPLAPGEQCTLGIRFVPAEISLVTFNLRIASTSGASATVRLSGTGQFPYPIRIYTSKSATQLDVKACSNTTKTPGDACFVDTAVGQQDGSRPGTPAGMDGPVTLLVAAAGSEGNSLTTGPLTLTVEGENPSDFVIKVTNCGPPLYANLTCTCVVSFRPKAQGLRSAVLRAEGTRGGLAIATLAGLALPPI